MSASKTFDLIVSWDTVEHLMDPAPAFERMYDSLAPGGYCAHLYHPFFCETGGHFDCLDIPWGHVVLATEDIDRFMAQYHPDEVEISRWRINETINRMTSAELRGIVSSTGFELVDLYPISIHQPELLYPHVLHLGQRNWPSLTAFDLLANYVFFLIRKL
jgi:SAM-dependent methyltransferase